jgi:hypothetical protein
MRRDVEGELRGCPALPAGILQETQMGFAWLGKRNETHLVVVTLEGPGRLRLNGNLVRSKKFKLNASDHPQTVCWIEFTPEGSRGDVGQGPSASRLGPGDVDRLLRELPQTTECRAVLQELRAGRERAGQWLRWGNAGAAPRGAMGDRSRQ